MKVVAGQTYELQVRWERNAEQAGPGQQVGKGSKGFILRTFIDRGYLTFEYFNPFPHWPESLVYQTSDALDRMLGRKS